MVHLLGWNLTLVSLVPKPERFPLGQRFSVWGPWNSSKKWGPYLPVNLLSQKLWGWGLSNLVKPALSQLWCTIQWENHCSKGLLCLSGKLLSCVWLFATPWTITCRAPLSMGILQTRTLEWVAMPFYCEIFPTQGSNPHLLHLLHWQTGSLTLSHQGSPQSLATQSKVVTYTCTASASSGNVLEMWDLRSYPRRTDPVSVFGMFLSFLHVLYFYLFTLLFSYLFKVIFGSSLLLTGFL